MPLRRYAPDSEAVVAEATTLLDPPPYDADAAKDSAGRALARRRSASSAWERWARTSRGNCTRRAGASSRPTVRLRRWRMIQKRRHPGRVLARRACGTAQVPRIIWLMITAGKGNDDLLFGKDGIVQHLKKGDIVIDAANAFYEDSVRRAKLLKKRGIHFMDVGFSGGPGGRAQRRFAHDRRREGNVPVGLSRSSAIFPCRAAIRTSAPRVPATS